MVSKTTKGGGIFNKTVELTSEQLDDLFKLFSEFKQICDSIDDDDFIDSLAQYRNLMGRFFNTDNDGITIDDANILINNDGNLDLITDSRKKNLIIYNVNVYPKIKRMNEGFKELLKLINKLGVYGVYKYKLLLNQNIPVELLSRMGCRLIDFQQILELTYFFDKEKYYRGLSMIDNRSNQDKLDDQRRHHKDKHNDFFNKLEKIDKQINSDRPVFDNLCRRSSKRYKSNYRFQYDDDTNGGYKRKRGVRKLKSYK